jgi:hypothetical protein
MTQILERVEKLERQNRGFKLLGLLLMVCAASFLVMGQTAPRKGSRVVEAEKLIIRNQNGKEVITLEALEGRASLALLTPDGFPSVILCDSENGPYLSLKTQDYKHLADLGIKSGSGGYLTFRGYSPNMKDIAPWFSVSGYWDNPVMEITDRQGFRTSIGVIAMPAQAKSGSVRTSAASMVMSDKDKRILWRSPGK